MKLEDIRVCILRIEGTNCEDELHWAFKALGAQPELVHLKQLLGVDVKSTEKRNLGDYQILMFPGGFSAGDYIRAGAIWAARIKASLGSELNEFASNGYAIGGICNGFQVLTELGLLPAFDNKMTERPEAALSVNDSGRFECRPSLLKYVNRGNCAFTTKIPAGKISIMPSAHAEGKFLVKEGTQAELYKKLEENDQIVFKYVNEEGDETAPYPYNPNGSIYNIAGICNPEGNVFGMMPHPERVLDITNHHDWYRNTYKLELSKPESLHGDGVVVFQSVLDYIQQKF
ncbi:MAG: phosphoribosylformylglycinamidine synthase subunit PurQ [Thermoplasmata archaeon]|nr:MAG: phosphoribosylformylglycinamidine synthase subunit PurQ [Thermoplasmata archaeon]